MYAFSIVLLVISGASYQIFQKMISPSAHPLVSLVCSYLTALALSVLGLLAYAPKDGLLESIKSLNAFSFLLALPIVGIELGYLLLYRNGGRLSFSSTLVSALVTLVLVLAGAVAFRERLDAKTLAGMALCLGGVALITIK